MAEENKTIRRERRAAGRVAFDDRGNSVWDWNPRTEAHSSGDTNALLEQLDNDTLALADTHGVEITARLQALRDEFEIYKRAEPQDDGCGLYPRERVPRKTVTAKASSMPTSSICSIDDGETADAGADPYNHGARKIR